MYVFIVYEFLFNFTLRGENWRLIWVYLSLFNWESTILGGEKRSTDLGSKVY